MASTGNKGKKRERSSILSTSSDKSTKKKAKTSYEVSDEASQKDTPLDRAAAAVKFEQEKAEILESIPQDYREMFGQIGFYPWTKTSLIPVLILNPFEVPPHIRAKWLTMYYKKKSREDMDTMSYLIYFYGTERENDYYFYSSREQFVPYEEEKKKKKSCYRLPQQLQGKLDSDKPLTPKELEIVQGYEEMEADLLLEPAERKRGVIHFDELHEFDENGDKDEDEEDAHLMEQDADVAGESNEIMEKKPTKPAKAKAKPAAPAKAKRGKAKKSLPSTVDDDVGPSSAITLETAGDLPTENEHPPKKKAKKGKETQIPASKKKNKKLSGVDVAQDEFAVSNEESGLSANEVKVLEAWKASVESKDVKEVEIQLRIVVAEVEAAPRALIRSSEFRPLLLKTNELYVATKTDSTSIDALNAALEQADSSEKVPLFDADIEREQKGKGVSGNVQDATTKSDDDDKNIGYALEEALSSNDEADDEFVDKKVDKEHIDSQVDDEHTDSMQARKEKKSVIEKTAKPKKVKPAKKVQKTKKEKVPSTKQIKAKEDEIKKKEEVAFRRCEENHWDLLQRWKRAIDSKSNQDLQTLIIEATDVAENFCATFIRGYQIGDILKESRKVLKDAGEDMTSYHVLKEKIKTAYALRAIGIPVAFAPKRTRPDLFANTTGKKTNDALPSYTFDMSQSQRSIESMDNLPMNVPKKGEAKSPRNKKSIDGEPMGPSLSTDRTDHNLVPTISLGRSGSSFSATAKVERKKFTLSTFMRPASKDEPAVETAATTEIVKEVVAMGQPIIPLWVKGPTTTAAPKGYPRSLALEFLIQMAEHLPEDSVNIESLSRSIEGAVFAWAAAPSKRPTGPSSRSTGTDWTTLYWARIHLIVAAICGKTEKGTIQDLLLQGHFDVPDKLVALSDDKLAASFEGQPVVL